MAMEFQKERLSILQAPGVFFQEHIFGSGMKIIVLLTDIAKVSEMMNVLITESRVHLVAAIGTAERMAGATFTSQSCDIYYLVRVVQ